jgi:hypothetical protein
MYHGINYHVNLSILHFSQLFQDEYDEILSCGVFQCLIGRLKSLDERY